MPADDLSTLVGDLAVLARALESRGAYNGGKLLRAVLDAELTRHALAEAPADPALADALDVLPRRLRVAGHEAAAALVPGIAAALSRDDVVTLDLVPPAAVCRVCGELFLGEAPRTCPTCDAPPLAFRDHLPTWFLDPMPPDQVLRELSTGAASVAAAIEGRDDTDLAMPPRPGEWSARDTLEHLVSTEELLAGRLDRLLSEDGPDFRPVTVAAASPPSDETTRSTGAPASRLVDRFATIREANVGRLAGLAPGEWERTGRHPEWGTVTVRSQAAYFARHQASHAAQLAAAAAGRVPGERLPAR
ncbi:MAG TPA: DinB family protein [Candidatus Limnocylindrales bacterium]